MSRAIWVRALLYMMVVGGGWLVLLPAGLLWLEPASTAIRTEEPPLLALGLLLLTAGVALALWGGYYLIGQGEGTPLPLDPPRRLVTGGPYAYVRNPQGAAMVLMVAGEIFIFQSRMLWVMLPLTLAYLELLVGPWEERQLTDMFGADYLEYRAQVRKWIPRGGRYGARLQPPK